MELLVLGSALVFGLPVLLAAMGVALALWLCMAVAAVVWFVCISLLGWPFLGVVLALAAGLWIGRAKAAPR